MPVPITIRQQVIDELIARLARIQIANGFQTDIGSSPAEDWPTRYSDVELREATRLGVFDLTNRSEQSIPYEKKIPNVLSMQVRIFHSRDTTPAELRVMLADVQRAVASDEDGNYEPTLGGIAVDMKPEEQGFVVPTEVFSIEGAAVAFTIEYLAAPFDGYAS